MLDFDREETLYWDVRNYFQQHYSSNATIVGYCLEFLEITANMLAMKEKMTKASQEYYCEVVVEFAMLFSHENEWINRVYKLMHHLSCVKQNAFWLAKYYDNGMLERCFFLLSSEHELVPIQLLNDAIGTLRNCLCANRKHLLGSIHGAVPNCLCMLTELFKRLNSKSMQGAHVLENFVELTWIADLIAVLLLFKNGKPEGHSAVEADFDLYIDIIQNRMEKDPDEVAALIGIIISLVRSPHANWKAKISNQKDFLHIMVAPQLLHPQNAGLCLAFCQLIRALKYKEFLEVPGFFEVLLIQLEHHYDVPHIVSALLESIFAVKNDCTRDFMTYRFRSQPRCFEVLLKVYGQCVVNIETNNNKDSCIKAIGLFWNLLKILTDHLRTENIIEAYRQTGFKGLTAKELAGSQLYCLDEEPNFICKLLESLAIIQKAANQSFYENMGLILFNIFSGIDDDDKAGNELIQSQIWALPNWHNEVLEILKQSEYGWLTIKRLLDDDNEGYDHANVLRTSTQLLDLFERSLTIDKECDARWFIPMLKTEIGQYFVNTPKDGRVMKKWFELFVWWLDYYKTLVISKGTDGDDLKRIPDLLCCNLYNFLPCFPDFDNASNIDKFGKSMNWMKSCNYSIFLTLLEKCQHHQDLFLSLLDIIACLSACPWFILKHPKVIPRFRELLKRRLKWRGGDDLSAAISIIVFSRMHAGPESFPDCYECLFEMIRYSQDPSVCITVFKAIKTITALEQRKSLTLDRKFWEVSGCCEVLVDCLKTKTHYPENNEALEMILHMIEEESSNIDKFCLIEGFKEVLANLLTQTGSYCKAIIAVIYRVCQQHPENMHDFIRTDNFIYRLAHILLSTKDKLESSCDQSTETMLANLYVDSLDCLIALITKVEERNSTKIFVNLYETLFVHNTVGLDALLCLLESQISDQELMLRVCKILCRDSTLSTLTLASDVRLSLSLAALKCLQSRKDTESVVVTTLTMLSHLLDECCADALVGKAQELHALLRDLLIAFEAHESIPKLIVTFTVAIVKFAKQSSAQATFFKELGDDDLLLKAHFLYRDDLTLSKDVKNFQFAFYAQVLERPSEFLKYFHSSEMLMWLNEYLQVELPNYSGSKDTSEGKVDHGMKMDFLMLLDQLTYLMKPSHPLISRFFELVGKNHYKMLLTILESAFLQNVTSVHISVISILARYGTLEEPNFIETLGQKLELILQLWDAHEAEDNASPVIRALTHLMATVLNAIHNSFDSTLIQLHRISIMNRMIGCFENFRSLHLIDRQQIDDDPSSRCMLKNILISLHTCVSTYIDETTLEITDKTLYETFDMLLDLVNCLLSSTNQVIDPEFYDGENDFVDEAFILLRAFSAIPHFIERCTPQTFQRYREILPKALVRYINGGLSAFCISEALVTLCKKSDEARTWLLYFHFHFPSLEEGVELSQTLMSWFVCVLGQNRVHTTVTSSFCQIMFVLIKDDIFDITSCQQFDVPWAIYNVSTALQAASGAVELRKDYEEVEWLVSIAHLLFKTLFNNDFGEVTSKFDIVSGQMSQCFGIVAELIHDHEMQSNLSICRDCSAILETILEFLFPYYPFPSEMISIIVKDLLSLISLHRQDMRIIEASVSSLVVLSKLPFSFDFADARQIWIESSFREALNFLFTENQPADSFTNIKPILTLLETLASQLEFHNEKRKYQLVSQTRWTSVLTDWISSNQNDVELISKISRLLSFEHIIKYLESLNSPHGSDSNLNMTDALVSLIRLHVQDHNTMISIVEMLYILCKTNQSLSRSLSLNMTCWSALSESLLLHRDHDDFVLSFCQFVCCLCSANESIELFMASLAKMLGKSNLSDDIRCIEVLLQIIQSRFGRQKSRIKRIAALAVEAGLAVCEVITILVTSVVSSKSFIVGNDREVSVVEKGKLQIASLLSLPTHNHDAESQFKVALRALEELSMNMQGGCKSTAQVNNKASNLSTEDISNSVPGVTAIPHDEIELSTMIDVNVYKGTWRKSTAVAVKINRGKKSIADAAIQAELERLCSLRHPRIVSALGLGVNLQIDGEIFHALVLEHMEKGTLRNVLNTEHAIMSTASRLTIAVDVCEGMRFLHESKLFHGSLSSESVLVDVYGRAKLSGLKSINLKKVYQYSQTKRSAKDKEGKVDNSDTSLERDQKDDVFGFGSIVWELMTGKKLPWTDFKQASKKSAKLTFTKEESTACPAVITAMMKHCLESLPMNRPAFSDISETLRLLHAQESKLWNDQQRVIPDGFICPITHDIMTDPVMLLDGLSYERKVIEDWLTRSGRSPLTNELLPHRTILDNYALKSAIESFLQQNPAVKHSI